MKLPVITLLCAASLAAQNSVVFPKSHANIANGASSISWFPYSSGISRQQIVYDDWDLELLPNTVITRIGFRQDGASTSPQRLVSLEVRMGATNASSNSLGSNFDNNFLGTPTVVFPQAVYTLPALSSVTPNTVIWLNLVNPYTYTGGNLLVEFRVYGNNNGNASFSYPLDVGTFVSTVTAGVLGCQHSGGQSPVLASSPTKVGGNWNLSLSQGPANTAVVLCIAPGQTMTTPYSLSILGLAPSCQGQLPPTFFAFSNATGGSGFTSWSVPVPNNLALDGYVLASQAALLDFFVPGSLVVSNADQVRFGVDPGASILYSTGSPTAPTGSVYSKYGVVTLFN